jgi:photosystem II stability/assembly factor-like uncharacterized protein
MKPQLYVATNGLGVWTSDNLGDTLTRMSSRTGMYSGYHVWGLAADPSDPNILYAGTNGGLYRLDRRQQKWAHVPSPMDERFKITAIAFSPHNPEVVIAGTQFAALYRSEDHGKSWRRLDLNLPEICQGNMAQARVTQILLDPIDTKLGWAGIELDHVWRTTDSGHTWHKITKGLESGDIHGLAVVNDGKRRVFATTDKGLHISDDDGESWRIEMLDSPSNYTRAIVLRAGVPSSLYLTNGDGPPGSWGRLYRSRDRGAHWERLSLPGEVQSSMWSIATHPADPKLLFASACLGQIYRSTNGGENWTALKRRLGEIRHVMWLPG